MNISRSKCFFFNHPGYCNHFRPTLCSSEALIILTHIKLYEHLLMPGSSPYNQCVHTFKFISLESHFFSFHGSQLFTSMLKYLLYLYLIDVETLTRDTIPAQTGLKLQECMDPAQFILNMWWLCGSPCLRVAH